MEKYSRLYLGVKYLFYNEYDVSKLYCIEPYKTYEKYCDKCEKTYYVKDIDFTEENGATMCMSESGINKFIVSFGTIMMYTGDTYHSVGENKTGKKISILLANFCSTEYEPLQMWNKEDKIINEQIELNDSVFSCNQRKSYMELKILFYYSFATHLFYKIIM